MSNGMSFSFLTEDPVKCTVPSGGDHNQHPMCAGSVDEGDLTLQDTCEDLDEINPACEYELSSIMRDDNCSQHDHLQNMDTVQMGHHVSQPLVDDIHSRVASVHVDAPVGSRQEKISANGDNVPSPVGPYEIDVADSSNSEDGNHMDGYPHHRLPSAITVYDEDGVNNEQFDGCSSGFSASSTSISTVLGQTQTVHQLGTKRDNNCSNDLSYEFSAVMDPPSDQALAFASSSLTVSTIQPAVILATSTANSFDSEASMNQFAFEERYDVNNSSTCDEADMPNIGDDDQLFSSTRRLWPSRMGSGDTMASTSSLGDTLDEMPLEVDDSSGGGLCDDAMMMDENSLAELLLSCSLRGSRSIELMTSSCSFDDQTSDT